MIGRQHNHHLEACIIAEVVAPMPVDRHCRMAEVAHGLGLAAEILIHIGAHHTAQLGIPLAEIDVTAHGPDKTVRRRNTPEVVSVQPAHISALSLEGEPFGQRQEEFDIQTIAVHAEQARRSLAVEAAQTQLLAHGKIIELETIAVIAILVHDRHEHLTRKGPVVTHVPAEPRGEVYQKIVLTLVVNIPEIEIQPHKDIHSRRRRLALCRLGELPHKQQHHRRHKGNAARVLSAIIYCNHNVAI